MSTSLIVFIVSKGLNIATVFSYSAAIPHWVSQNWIETLIKERPTSVMVGTIVNGPINFSSQPNKPVAPIKTCVSEANIMPPCIYKYQKHDSWLIKLKWKVIIILIQNAGFHICFIFCTLASLNLDCQISVRSRPETAAVMLLVPFVVFKWVALTYVDTTTIFVFQ